MLFVINILSNSLFNLWSISNDINLIIIVIFGILIFYRSRIAALLFLFYFVVEHFIAGYQIGIIAALKNPVLFILLLAFMVRGVLGTIRLHQIKEVS